MNHALPLLTALLLAPLAAPHAADKSSKSDKSCGDRHPAVNCVYPENAFLHAGKGGRLIDVTKLPFAAGDGKTDDTGALIAALDYCTAATRPTVTGTTARAATSFIFRSH